MLRKSLLPLLILTASIVVLLFYYYFSPLTGEWPAGLQICRNDCAHYDRLSTEIAGGNFEAYQHGYHGTIFYRGYVFYLAFVKAVFGGFWQNAYGILNGLWLGLFFLMCFRFLKSKNPKPVLLLLGVHLLLNHRLILQAKFLLTDYLFCLGFGATTILLSWGASLANRTLIYAGVIASFCMMTIRPNGAFLAAVSIVFLVFSLKPKLYRSRVFLSLILLTGIGAFFVSPTVTSHFYQKVDNIEEARDGRLGAIGNSAYELLLINYFGDNKMTHATRKGSLIVNFPYVEHYYHGGSFGEMVFGELKRIPKIFEFWDVRSGRIANLYRCVYYPLLFLSFVMGVAHFVRRRKQYEPQIFLIALLGSYLFFFVALSQVETRFKLPFDIGMILVSVSYLKARFFANNA